MTPKKVRCPMCRGPHTLLRGDPVGVLRRTPSALARDGAHLEDFAAGVAHVTAARRLRFRHTLGFAVLTAMVAFPLAGVAQSAAEGEKLYASLRQKYPRLEISVHGAATDTPAVGDYLPETEWAALTKRQQVSLTLYVESFIARARANPDGWIRIPRTAPAYQMFRRNTANIKDGAWFIGVGTLTPRGDDVTFDRWVVVGDTLWEAKAAEYRRHGLGPLKAARGSDFRK